MLSMTYLNLGSTFALDVITGFPKLSLIASRDNGRANTPLKAPFLRRSPFSGRVGRSVRL